MERREFLAMSETFFSRCQDLLERKSQDYTGPTDQLQDVKAFGSEMGISAGAVLFIYMQKHISAVRNYVVGKVEASEPIESRLVDLANYAALIYAWVLESKKEALGHPE